MLTLSHILTTLTTINYYYINIYICISSDSCDFVLLKK